MGQVPDRRRCRVELIVFYLGFVLASFGGAHLVAGFLMAPTPYIVAGAALAGHIVGAVVGLSQEKRWGNVTGILSLATSALLVVAGASVLLQRWWPLTAAAGISASALLYWAAHQINVKRGAAGRDPIHTNVMVALALIPAVAVTVLASAIAVATGAY